MAVETPLCKRGGERPMRSLLRRCLAALLAAGTLCLHACARDGTSTSGPCSPGPANTENPVSTAWPDAGQERLAGMTLRQKVGQLFVVRPDALDLTLSQQDIDDADARGVTALTDSMAETLRAYPVGGIVFFGKNIETPQQLRTLTADLRSASQTGLFIAVDEEGGAVARLANTPGFDLPVYESTAAVGALGPEAARAQAAAIGAYLAEYGFDLNFAPVADVSTNPGNTVIGTRAFASDAQMAADCVAGAVAGYAGTGVACCLKHFPGHGDTAQDSHDGAVYTEKTLDELRLCEFLPFAAGIDAGAPLVMAGHIQAPNAWEDGLPASLSPQALTGILRGELGFKGLIVTDSLSMGAITTAYTPGEAAVLALQAGADLLLMPAGLADAFDGVITAVEDGRLSEGRIDESVFRILTLKQQLGLL